MPSESLPTFLSPDSARSKNAATPPIQPGDPASLKLNLPEGSYQASTGQQVNAESATVKVGPEREGSQDQLLQP
jgi:hypothetical protein